MMKVAFVLFFFVVLCRATTNSSCCNSLFSALGDKISLPNSTVYESSLDSYYSLQEQSILPSCIVSPTTSQDVSKSVIVLAQQECKFAIRSGGHTPWAGSANIEAGVTIDLSALNEVTVSADQTITSIGAGNRWVDVYMKLDALGLTVPGGRSAYVGVGGLTTGGGISFYAARKGFVADNIVNFEVVLASGEIVNANQTYNSDLWFALKGGSNNFGIVTRFDSATFEQGDFWGGFTAYSISTLSQQLSAFVDFAGQPSYDPYGALIMTFSYVAAIDLWLVENDYEYTQPIAYPPVFQNFTNINETSNTMRISNLSDFTLEIGSGGAQPSDKESNIFYTRTYGNDLDLLTKAFEITNKTVQSLQKVPGLTWSLTYQPIPTAITRWGEINGGNPLGLTPEDGNLALILSTVTWNSTSDDDLVYSAVKKAFAEIDTEASSKGLLNEYIYLNYADKSQNPILGYNSTNVEKLKNISCQYDPDQVFQKLVPGGFKLGI